MLIIFLTTENTEKHGFFYTDKILNTLKFWRKTRNLVCKIFRVFRVFRVFRYKYFVKNIFSYFFYFIISVSSEFSVVKINSVSH